jgi:hypothetical protein
VRALLNPRVTPQTTWSIPWRRAEIGGMKGHGNARRIATAQSVLANGGAYGKRLLSDAGREQVLRTQFDGVDLVLGIPMRWGMGYALPSPSSVNFAPRSAFWAGNGGSLSYVDLDARMSIGYAMNKCIRGEHENDRWLSGVYGSEPSANVAAGRRALSGVRPSRPSRLRIRLTSALVLADHPLRARRLRSAWLLASLAKARC